MKPPPLCLEECFWLPRVSIIKHKNLAESALLIKHAFTCCDICISCSSISLGGADKRYISANEILPFATNKNKSLYTNQSIGSISKQHKLHKEIKRVQFKRCRIFCFDSHLLYLWRHKYLANTFLSGDRADSLGVLPGVIRHYTDLYIWRPFSNMRKCEWQLQQCQLYLIYTPY